MAPSQFNDGVETRKQPERMEDDFLELVEDEHRLFGLVQEFSEKVILLTTQLGCRPEIVEQYPEFEADTHWMLSVSKYTSLMKDLADIWWPISQYQRLIGESIAVPCPQTVTKWP
jgi:hypothetical protein